VISGGTIVVHGPQSSPEVGMDYNGTCTVSGGFLVISGTNSNMTQAPGTASSIYSLKMVSSASIAASTLFHIQDASGNDVVTFKPVRSYYSVVLSSALITAGSSYSIYTGGSSTGINSNGLYTGGVYSGGTLKKTFTVSAKVSSVSF
jgi:trimeric autotransporter adhesin